MFVREMFVCLFEVTVVDHRISHDAPVYMTPEEMSSTDIGSLSVILFLTGVQYLDAGLYVKICRILQKEKSRFECRGRSQRHIPGFCLKRDAL